MIGESANMEIKPKLFEYTSCKFEPAPKKLIFNYKIEFINKKPLEFTETIVLPANLPLKKIPQGLLDNLLQNLHLILGISYYKLYCPPKIKLNKPLSQEQAAFWQTVYRKGLGEFFYRNKIDSKRSPQFPFDKNFKPVVYELKTKDRALVGLGGGKDSIVAVELLKEQKYDITAFIVETRQKQPVIDTIADKAGIGSLKIQRFLDKKIFEKHEGGYNGHIPISAVFAFLGFLSAALYDYSSFIVANEYSSNFGNLEYQGEIINHQWSKSSEFEKLFQAYTKNFITPDIDYFSVLRQFYEIRIAKMFSGYKKYFPYFSSCNKNFRINKQKTDLIWCNQCPKCLFSFLLLSAFLTKKELLDIFKKNLYQEKNLLPVFKDLLGFGKLKPFDCVGTFEEAQAALYLASKKYPKDLVIKTLLLKVENPAQLTQKVLQTNSAPTLPPQFKFLGIENLLILGYGKEGKITHQYLRKKFPELKIAIADKNLDPNYLEKQPNFDLAIKTPGIHKSLVSIPYTTATNLFFSAVKNNLTIGITGSKGKSTTASLIYAILRETKKDTQLLGNIGKPMLEALIRPVKKNTIFVLELSSYQLDDSEFSPNIAVVLDLFPEHMDYHQKVTEYYQAKKNIINFQRKNDFFIYNPKNKMLALWAKPAVSSVIPFTPNLPLKDSDLPLIGEHNKQNIRAAVTVAKLLNVPDSVIKKAIKNFKPLPHRLEYIGTYKGIKFYDDAISTTPESAIMAIRSLPQIGTIFLGGEDRGYNFTDLEKTIKQYKIKNIVLFPNSGNRILKSAKNLNILKTKSMEEAVKFAYKNTPKGSICLLSTASPSYSLWKNFEEKGNQFQYFVKKYGVLR